MQQINAERERQPELREVHYGFQEQGKRLSDCLSRLTIIANKLEDESEIITEGVTTPVQNLRMAGITNDLINTTDGYKDCISQIERQLNKIERHI